MAAKTLKEFDSLTRRDFDNGAVLDEIRSVYKQRDALLRVTKGAITILGLGATLNEQWVLEAKAAMKVP